MPGTPLSSPIQRDGDTAFLGFQSRRNPLTIKEGYLQKAVNMRLDRGIAQTRKGAKRLARNISTELPLILPFELQTPLAISSITRITTTATVTTSAPHGLSTGALVNIIGATPNTYNGDKSIVVTGASEFTFRILGNPSTPATGTIKYATGPIVKIQYNGGISLACVFSSPNYDNSNEYIVLAGPNSTFLWRDETSIEQIFYPTSPIVERIDGNDIVNMVQAYDRLYLFRSRPEALFKINTLTSTGGTATATTFIEHGYDTGEVVRIAGASAAGLNQDAEITVTSTTTFTYPVPTTTSSNTADGVTALRVCCPMVWLPGDPAFTRVPVGTSTLGPTFSTLTAPDNAIATYFNNQLVVANARDSVMISDVYDAENFDPLQKALRTNVGSNDHLVALHPYADGQLVVFMRKSIYLATIILDTAGTSIDPTKSSIRLLTNEIGCNSARSIATAGNYLYFLSDNGVYRLDNSQIDLALRGNTMPLSEPVDDVIQTINPDAVGLANAVYFDNRYWLSIPTKLANGTPSPTCNSLLIYNQLNEAWESLDSYSFTISNLLVSDYGTRRRLFAASTTGLLYLLDEYDNALDDQAVGNSADPVVGSFTTRRYFYGILARKRLGIAAVSAFIPSGAKVSVKAVATDRDVVTTIAEVTNTDADNDYTIKAPMRRTAEYLDLTIESSGGRPQVRALSADVTLTSDNSRLARTES
jgi:hypothetical protein